MIAYHFLRADMRTHFGTEPPWRVGETRRWEGACVLGMSGYHSATSWRAALHYAKGPVACVVEVSEPVQFDSGGVQVSQERTLLAARDVTRDLRVFACDCAERMLARLRAQGVDVSPRVDACIAVARRDAEGYATEDEMAHAREIAESLPVTTASFATLALSRAEMWAHAYTVAFDDLCCTPVDAKLDERDWQSHRLAELLDAAVSAPSR